MTDGDKCVIMAVMIFCALAFLAWFYRLLFPAKPDPVIGSELQFDRVWLDEAQYIDMEKFKSQSGQAPHRYHSFGDGDLPASDDIIATHLGLIKNATASKRTNKGTFDASNRPHNIGVSKQIERLHLSGVPHASAVAMMDADCTMQERRVIHMREQGDSLTLIAERLGVSVAKVRRLEASAVDKIIAARKKP